MRTKYEKIEKDVPWCPNHHKPMDFLAESEDGVKIYVCNLGTLGICGKTAIG